MHRTLALVAAVLVALGAAPPAGGQPQEPVSVTITSPTRGATVSGSVHLEAETTGPVTSVTFAWSTDGGSTWTPIGPGSEEGATWSAVWDSTGHDGEALLRATATEGTISETDHVEVVVDNLPPGVSVKVSPGVFSPNGDGRKDRVVIRTPVSEETALQVRVRGGDGATVRQWSVVTAGPEIVRIEWNGRADGSVVPDGRYRVTVEAVDAAGLEARAATPLVVDVKPPTVRWIGIAPEPLVNQRRMTFSFRARDRAPTVRVILRVFDASGRRMARIRRTVATGRRRIAWAPRRPGGGPLFPGNYRAILRIRDDAGNDSPLRRRAFRVHRPVPARVFTRVAGAGRWVALTFDDCHMRRAWSRILHVLRQKRVQATFFCPGQMVRWNPDLARRTVREGHVPASHAWDHAYLPGRGIDATASRIRADARAWWDVARATTAPYFRPPYGAYDRSVIAGAGAAFHPRVMMWDVDTSDWRRPGSSVIAARAVRGSRAGSVVLMHTLDQTAAALPSIIDGLRRRGLEPVGLPQLFRAAGLP